MLDTAPSPVLHVTSSLFRWFRDVVRPILEEHAADRIQEFERQLREIEQLTRRQADPLSACFLGQSQIGKSTLINALVAQTTILLPAGGVGPLTAQAIQVGYAATPFLEVCYQPKKKVNQLIFALERQLDRTRTAEGKSSNGDPEDGYQIEEEDRSEIVALDAAEDKGGAIRDRIHQAKLLVTGGQNQQIDLDYLCDALRLACEWPNKWNTVLRSEHQHNIGRLTDVLRCNGKAPHRASGSTDNPTFLTELNAHAAGALSPMVRTLDLGWPSGLLKPGIQLVDLPGVGIADDAHRVITKEWIGERANTVCLVVTNSGVDESSAELLRSSGFLNRLLYSVNDPNADPVMLCVIVVKMDDLARARHDAEKQILGHQCRKRVEHLREVGSGMPTTIRSQLREQLNRLASDAEGEARHSLQVATERIIEALQVFPVSAMEYRKLLSEDDEDPPFIKSSEDSGIPQLITAIAHLAEELRARNEARVQAQANNLRDRVLTLLESIHAQWLEDTEEVEAERIRRLLQPFLDPKKRELAARQGKFHEFLDATVAERIDAMIAEAANSAQTSMRRYIRSLGDANWSTLKAVVVRGGAFYGRRPIDLPRELSLTFEEHLAPIWSRKVIAEVRSRTKGLADDYVAVIEEVVTWAQENGAKNQSKVVEALADHIREDGKRMVQVGKDGADDLRDLVKKQLMKGIEDPIRRRCKSFVDSGGSTGRGVKLRMLSLFEDEILEVVLKAARPPASRILKDNFEKVRAEIVECFREYPDPLKSAEEQIIGRHLESEKRSKAKQRARVLGSIGKARRIAPRVTVHQVDRDEVAVG